MAAIHTEILKNTELNAFYRLYPEKFNNKTNGITFRRWLMSCNRELSTYLAQTIGDGFKKDADKLEKLLEFKDNPEVLDQIAQIKMNRKQELVAYVKENEGVTLNPDSIFDIQIKRLHEYKRQQMNALYIIHKYLEIKQVKSRFVPSPLFSGQRQHRPISLHRTSSIYFWYYRKFVNNDPGCKPVYDRSDGGKLQCNLCREADPGM